MTPLNRESRPCILARLACLKCGPVRMALAPQDTPVTTLECPYCFGEAKAEQIGTGITQRNLPYFEAEGLFDAALRHPPGNGPVRRIESGQVVIYCPEGDILHLAVVGDVHTSRQHLSPGGPAISFRIGGEETPPAPHLSGCGQAPPFWCWPDEIRQAWQEAEVKPKPRKRGKR